MVPSNPVGPFPTYLEKSGILILINDNTNGVVVEMTKIICCKCIDSSKMPYDLKSYELQIIKEYCYNFRFRHSSKIYMYKQETTGMPESFSLGYKPTSLYINTCQVFLSPLTVFPAPQILKVPRICYTRFVGKL